MLHLQLLLHDIAQRSHDSLSLGPRVCLATRDFLRVCADAQMQYVNERANLPGACPKFAAALRRDAGDLTACRRTGPSTEVITIAPNVNTKLLGTSHELSAVRAGPSFGALLPQFPPRLCRCRRDGSIADLGRDAGLLKHVPRDEILNSVLFLPHA